MFCKLVCIFCFFLCLSDNLVEALILFFPVSRIATVWRCTESYFWACDADFSSSKHLLLGLWKKKPSFYTAILGLTEHKQHFRTNLEEVCVVRCEILKDLEKLWTKYDRKHCRAFTYFIEVWVNFLSSKSVAAMVNDIHMQLVHLKMEKGRIKTKLCNLHIKKNDQHLQCCHVCLIRLYMWLSAHITKAHIVSSRLFRATSFDRLDRHRQMVSLLTLKYGLCEAAGRSLPSNYTPDYPKLIQCKYLYNVWSPKINKLHFSNN